MVDGDRTERVLRCEIEVGRIYRGGAPDPEECKPVSGLFVALRKIEVVDTQ